MVSVDVKHHVYFDHGAADTVVPGLGETTDPATTTEDWLWRIFSLDLPNEYR